MTDAIWAADRKLRCADMTNQPAMIGGVACDDNFAELGALSCGVIALLAAIPFGLDHRGVQPCR